MKKKVIVDTNVILRFLTNDVPAQAKKALVLFERARDGQYEIYVLAITIVEVIFHLENWCKLGKLESISKMTVFLSPKWVKYDKNVIDEALRLYRKKNIDFVDLLTWSFAKKKGIKIASFDRHFSKLAPNLVIEL